MRQNGALSHTRQNRQPERNNQPPLRPRLSLRAQQTSRRVILPVHSFIRGVPPSGLLGFLESRRRTTSSLVPRRLASSAAGGFLLGPPPAPRIVLSQLGKREARRRRRQPWCPSHASQRRGPAGRPGPPTENGSGAKVPARVIRLVSASRRAAPSLHLTYDKSPHIRSILRSGVQRVAVVRKKHPAPVGLQLVIVPRRRGGGGVAAPRLLR